MPAFDFSSGALCLDFANTWGNRAEASQDRLQHYDDLLLWALQGGIVTGEEEATVAELAAQQPAEAADVFQVCRVLRENLFHLFSAISTGRTPAGEDLEELNLALSRSPRLRLCCGGPCCRWERSTDDLGLDCVLWPVVRSAADLLTSDDAKRVRECNAPDCSWLFLDFSRGGRRRWCDMSTCGNRAKARRHYERKRLESKGEQSRRHASRD